MIKDEKFEMKVPESSSESMIYNLQMPHQDLTGGYGTTENRDFDNIPFTWDIEFFDWITCARCKKPVRCKWNIVYCVHCGQRYVMDIYIT